ncbi:mitochondrial resolvase Ydc2 [Aspergillus karnatakaensis]|uniref:uncharacterized protein n=1 Tax=Aspergillus karnatakaensis TaxID=1810916 RepID=UPI003CCE2030
MLWAVLHSLAQSQQGLSLDAKSVEKDVKGAEGSAGRSRPKVIAIEPARVGRFWASALASPSASEAKSEKKEKAKKSSRENKKLKIDLVGSWLQDKRFMIGDDGQEWADGYMMKWDKSTAPRPKSETKTQSETKAESELIEVGKLDDLADCLVQGVTWLEWEGVKGRIVRDGAAAFENIL